MCRYVGMVVIAITRVRKRNGDGRTPCAPTTSLAILDNDRMRITVDLNEQLIDEARRLSGIDDRTALIHEGLRELIHRGSALKLAKLGGTQPNLKPVPRRR